MEIIKHDKDIWKFPKQVFSIGRRHVYSQHFVTGERLFQVAVQPLYSSGNWYWPAVCLSDPVFKMVILFQFHRFQPPCFPAFAAFFPLSFFSCPILSDVS